MCYEDGWLFKRGKEEVWPEVNPLFRSSGRASTCHVLAKDVFTGDLIQFSSITHAAKDLELAPSAILDCVKTEGVRPLRGYVFRYRTPEVIWPSYSDKDLKVYRLCPIRNGSAVIEYDEMGNEVNFFETIKIAAQRLSTSASTVERECRGLKTPLTGKKFISFYEPPGTFKSRSPAQVTE